jgi:hypothetical protein
MQRLFRSSPSGYEGRHLRFLNPIIR